MDLQLVKIIETFSKPRNHTEVLLKLHHLNRQSENVLKNPFHMCQKCLMPWKLGMFELNMKPSNSKRISRRNQRIERFQAQIKSKELTKNEMKALSRKVARLQRQNNHVALYKCLLCSKTTKVQLRKKRESKQKKSENVTSVMITSEKTKYLEDEKKVKTKKKKKKTAGLLIPPKTSVKIDVASSSSTHIDFTKISQMLKKNINEAKQPQKNRLNQFLK